MPATAPEATSNPEARAIAITINVLFILITPFNAKIIIFIKLVKNDASNSLK